MRVCRRELVVLRVELVLQFGHLGNRRREPEDALALVACTTHEKAKGGVSALRLTAAVGSGTVGVREVLGAAVPLREKMALVRVVRMTGTSPADSSWRDMTSSSVELNTVTGLPPRFFFSSFSFRSRSFFSFFSFLSRSFSFFFSSQVPLSSAAASFFFRVSWPASREKLLRSSLCPPPLDQPHMCFVFVCGFMCVCGSACAVVW